MGGGHGSDLPPNPALDSSAWVDTPEALPPESMSPPGMSEAFVAQDSFDSKKDVDSDSTLETQIDPEREAKNQPNQQERGKVMQEGKQLEHQKHLQKLQRQQQQGAKTVAVKVLVNQDETAFKEFQHEVHIMR